MWIFTTREIAIFIYAILFISYIIVRNKTRSTIIPVIKAAFHIKLIVPFLLILLFASGVTYLCTFLPFWNWQYIKDIIFWTLFAGVPICFNATSRKVEEHYFKNIIIDNLKFTALVEFFTGTFTFHIIFESILQPILFILMILQSTLVKKSEKTQKSIDGFVGLFGLGIIALTIKSAIDSINSVQFIDIAVGFVLPMVLSILYLPVAYFFAVYAKYEILFMRMSFKEPNDKKIKLKHRLDTIKVCRLSYKKICRFLNEYIPKMYVTMNQETFETLLIDFKKNN